MSIAQDAGEQYVAIVECAMPGLKTPMEEEVPDFIRELVLELAGLLAMVVRPRILQPWKGEDLVVGVELGRLTRDGQPYTMILRTHERAGAVQDGRILIDGVDGRALGPPPSDHLDGFRFSVALSGLLRITEAEVRRMIASGDWSWGPEDWEADGPLHPEEMLRRVRAWRRDVKQHLLVAAVHAL